VSIHNLYGVEYGTDKIGGVKALRIETGSESRNEVGDGGVYPTQAPIHAQNPMIEFTTRAIDTALGSIGAVGAAIGTVDFDAYAQAHDEGGTRKGASSHRQYTVNEGLVVPRRLSCGHQDDAEITYEVLPTWNGTNDPIVITDGVSLPSGFADDERWTLGACTIESFACPWLERLELDFGVEVRREGAASAIWPQFASIVTIKPRLTLRGIDPTWLKSTNIPFAGKAVTHANTAVYLRKRSGASFASGSVHLKFTFCGLAYIDQALEADGSDPAGVSLVMPLLHDGTNNPVVVSQNQALP